jgi:hypothetical protein
MSLAADSSYQQSTHHQLADGVRPTVFISYSSSDHELIARLDSDLQAAGITVWRDERRITPGQSLRSTIFRDGIAKSDHVVVYLTAKSITSPWVSQELDAASVMNTERDGVFLSLFVDSNHTRDRLTPDLRALQSPVLNDTTYEQCLRSLISNSWRGLIARRNPFGTGYPPAIEQAVAEQLLLRPFYKSNVVFHIVVKPGGHSAALFETELSYSVTNRTDVAHHWYVGKTFRFPTTLREVFFNGAQRDTESLDNRDARGLRVPCLLEPGETGEVLIRVHETVRLPDSDLYTSYYPATDLRVHVTFPEDLIKFDVERLYFIGVQPRREAGLLEVVMDRGVLPYQGLRLNWQRRES